MTSRTVTISSDSDRQKLFASLVPRLIDYIYAQGYSCTFGDAYRSPQVKYGHENSLHRHRLAIDLNLFDQKGRYLTDSESHRPFGEYWQSLDPECTWGGEEDGNHYSMFASHYNMKF